MLFYILASDLWPCWQWPHSSVSLLTPDTSYCVHSAAPLTPLCPFSFLSTLYTCFDNEKASQLSPGKSLNRYAYTATQILCTNSLVSEYFMICLIALLQRCVLHKHIKWHMATLQDNKFIKSVMTCGSNALAWQLHLHWVPILLNSRFLIRLHSRDVFIH